SSQQVSPLTPSEVLLVGVRFVPHKSFIVAIISLPLAFLITLPSFNTSKVANMSYMFQNSKATTLDLSSFDTSKVTNMSSMFRDSAATTLDLSSFNTSSVTSMSYMFRDSAATTLDLSSFDTSKVTNMTSMFQSSKATTGYARTQADADKFNASSNKPAGLTFIVKP
ncbi:MAG TPA: BspA family leucine-rich repeat surface protein, partial [Atopostipes sp.]|nr:BspA family leucine-rich repeat surface protein [Atopostipes sp.]